jgi:hypothetical protein
MAEGLGDIVVGMADHRLCQIADEPASGILRQSPQDIEGEIRIRDKSRFYRHQSLDAGDGAK